MEVSDQLPTPAAFLRGRIPEYSLIRRMVGLQTGIERCGEEKNLLLLPEIEPRAFRPSLDAIPSYPDSYGLRIYTSVL
jgi:hypothetical protein